MKKVKRFETGKTDVILEILAHTTVGLIDKGLLFPRKMFCGWDLPYLEVNRIDK